MDLREIVRWHSLRLRESLWIISFERMLAEKVRNE